jgi:hypothetical protein
VPLEESGGGLRNRGRTKAGCEVQVTNFAQWSHVNWTWRGSRILVGAQREERGVGRFIARPLVELAAHPLKSCLGEVRQRRLAALVAFQHPKSHQAKQHGTGHLIRRA